jgi:hypothetical protein
MLPSQVGGCPEHLGVCLLDTVHKVLSAVFTDRLYQLAERRVAGPLTGGCTPRSGRCRACTGPCRTRQSGVRPSCAATLTSRMPSTQRTWTLRMRDNVDHAALWQSLQELNVPDMHLLQGLYSEAYYQADLPYGRSAEVGPLTGAEAR